MKQYHYYTLLICVLICESCGLLTEEESSRQMPQPDLSALKDDTGETQLSDEFLPAVMIALHYYTDMMQYQKVENAMITQKPTTVKSTTTTTTTTTRRQTTKTTTTRPITRSTTTTRRPTPTTRRTTTSVTQRTTPTTRRSTTTKPQYHSQRPHMPGVYAPEKPIYFTYFNYNMKPEQNYYHKPGLQQQTGITTIAEPDWKDKDFLNWFFQSKPKEIESFDENALQYLDILPKTLLMDIYQDYLRRPALLDYDNVIEFRKVFDDSYRFQYGTQEPTREQMLHNMRIQVQQQRPSVIFKKKVPPTRPYVLMLMLYDLLKREAKTKKLHQYEGFSENKLKELNDHSQTTGVYQMIYLLEGMLDNKEITTPDIIARTNVIIKDLKTETSDAYKALIAIPPVPFI